jgi:hypothetical protein
MQECLSDDVLYFARKEIKNMTTAKVTRIVSMACLAAGVTTIGRGLAAPPGATAASGDRPTPDAVLQTARDVDHDESIHTRVAAAATAEQSQQDAEQQPTRPPVLFDLKPRSPAEKKILAALDEPTRLEFVDTPLTEVVDYLSEIHSVQIMLDTRSLEDAGIDTSTETIDAELYDVRLANALDLILEPLNLVSQVYKEVLLVTTTDAAESRLEARVYDLNLTDSAVLQLTKLIQGVAAPESWESMGGPGYIGSFRGSLVIRQTERIHREIHGLLRQLNQQHP